MEVYTELKKKQMKNLMLLTITLMMSFTSFSQSDTDSTTILLKKPIVKLVIKDLIKGDAAKKEVVVFNDIIKQQEIQLFTKDTIITTLDLKVINLESIITDKSNQTNLSQELNAELEKALKTQKRRTFIYKVGTGVGAVLALILLAK
tara:strand:+ start:368 stop:808 length:441 start_codon:yes stop_codon:yes gene_type:complete